MNTIQDNTVKMATWQITQMLRTSFTKRQADIPTNLHALSVFREEESANHVLKRLVSFSGSGLAALDNK